MGVLVRWRIWHERRINEFWRVLPGHLHVWLKIDLTVYRRA